MRSDLHNREWEPNTPVGRLRLAVSVITAEGYGSAHPITSRVFWYPFLRLRSARSGAAFRKVKNHLELLRGQIDRSGWILISICVAVAVAWTTLGLSGHALCSLGAIRHSCELSGFFLTLWGLQAALVTLLGLALTLAINMIQQTEIPVPSRALRSEAWLGIATIVNGIPILWPIVWTFLPAAVQAQHEPVPIPVVLIGWLLLVRSLSVLLAMTRPDNVLSAIRDYLLTLLVDLYLTHLDWRTFALWRPTHRCSVWTEVRIRLLLAPLDHRWRESGGPDIVFEEHAPTGRVHAVIADRRSSPTQEQARLLIDAERIINANLRYIARTFPPPAMREVSLCAAALSRGLSASATRAPVEDWDTRLGAVASVMSLAALNVSVIGQTLAVPRRPLGRTEAGLSLARLEMAPGIAAAGERIPMQGGFPNLWGVARECMPGGAFYSHAASIYDIEGTASRFPQLLWACTICGAPGLFFSRVLLPSARGGVRKLDHYAMVLTMRQVARGGGSALHSLLTRDDWPKAALQSNLEQAIHDLSTRVIIDMRALQDESLPGLSSRHLELCNLLTEVLTVGRNGPTALTLSTTSKIMDNFAQLTEGDVPPTGAGELGPWRGLQPLHPEPVQALWATLTEALGPHTS